MIAEEKLARPWDHSFLYENHMDAHRTWGSYVAPIEFVHRTVKDFVREKALAGVLAEAAGSTFDPALSVMRASLQAAKETRRWIRHWVDQDVLIVADLARILFEELAEDVLVAARNIEPTSRRISFELLQCLELLVTGAPTLRCTIHKLWPVPSVAMTHCNTIAIVISFGVSSYALDRLEGHLGLASSEQRQLWLLCAVLTPYDFMISEHESDEQTAQIVAKICQAGGNVNQAMEMLQRSDTYQPPLSVWQQYHYHLLLRHCNDATYWWIPCAQNVPEIVSMLLEAGADPGARLDRQYIRHIFEDSSPDNRLRNLLRHKSVRLIQLWQALELIRLSPNSERELHPPKLDTTSAIKVLLEEALRKRAEHSKPHEPQFRTRILKTKRKAGPRSARSRRSSATITSGQKCAE